MKCIAKYREDEDCDVLNTRCMLVCKHNEHPRMQLENVELKPTQVNNYYVMGIYYKDTLLMTIDETSDDDTINLFFTVHNGASIHESLIYNEDNTSTITHELLWNIKS